MFPTVIASSNPSTYPTTIPSFTPSEFPSKNPSASPSACVDEVGWKGISSAHEHLSGLSCYRISQNPSVLCDFHDVAYEGKLAKDACCVCGGGNHLSTAPSIAPSNNPTFVPTMSSHPTIFLEETPSTSPTTCKDEPWYWSSSNNHDCGGIIPDHCGYFKHVYINGKNAYAACCVCGGGQHIPKNEYK